MMQKTSNTFVLIAALTDQLALVGCIISPLEFSVKKFIQAEHINKTKSLEKIE